MRKFALALALSSSTMLLAADTAAERLSDADKVFTEIMSTPDKGIPQDLLEKAHCIVIVPGLKQAAFVVGGKFGRGYAVCRQKGGGWGAPAAVRVEGGSVGFQIGGSSTEVVMLVMNEQGMRRLLQDKFTLGGEATVAAGPVGRSTSANTDVQLSAEILSWSRSKGLFAGIALEGATLRPDLDVNQELYGAKLTNKEILTGDVKPPASARPLIAALSKYSYREAKDTPIENRMTDADRKKK
ncbi:MAG TPA: lipid-binding SYLF domain-containing protein [Candidatus Solibacter sp.]